MNASRKLISIDQDRTWNRNERIRAAMPVEDRLSDEIAHLFLQLIAVTYPDTFKPKIVSISERRGG
jgi:hypothetical protein